MLNKRMLAVAAVVALAVPALGAASPYLPVVASDPVPEQLVEGHTVFTIIEVNRTTEANGTTRFAAAVAVLVREAKHTSAGLRFPGVLWFNDQYLVNPQEPGDALKDYRYPCGGAVMAVNRGDPDPRLAMAAASASTPAGAQAVPGGPQGAWVNATLDAGDPANPRVDVSSDTVPSVLLRNESLAGLSYVESYQVMDPNDHNWFIDRYQAYHRTGLSRLDQRTYEYPVWVVNIMGSQAFVPDEGELDCTPFYDTAVTPFLGQPAANVTKNVSCTYMGNGQVPGGDKPIGHYGVDDPCGGYAQPSRNGYCYGGQGAPPEGCGTAKTPLRLYNAVLYFHLEDLRVAGAPRQHTTSSTDTNGCQAGTEWSCPAGGDDAEGNSHPFHPREHRPGASEEGPCVETRGNQDADNVNPTDHAGSSGANPGADANGTYEPLPCDFTHATRDIDVYFSPQGRPMRPLFPRYVVWDHEGSDAPFHDYATAYSATH